MCASASCQAAQGGLEVALGVDQEVGGDDDFVAFRRALPDFDKAVAVAAELHRPGLEATVALVDQHHLARAAIDHGAVGDRQDRRLGSRGDFDIRVHIGPQQAIGISDLDPHSGRAGLGVQLRIDQCDRPLETVRERRLRMRTAPFCPTAPRRRRSHSWRRRPGPRPGREVGDAEERKRHPAPSSHALGCVAHSHHSPSCVAMARGRPAALSCVLYDVGGSTSGGTPRFSSRRFAPCQ